MASTAGDNSAVTLESLDTQQLLQLKQQLDEEIEHLATSFNQLHAAQLRFRECLVTIRDGLGKSKGDQTILVPLTNSLYCRGEFADPSRVMVDVGTGFYVEKDLPAATKFYGRKTDQLAVNMRGLESIIQQKTAGLQSLDGVLRKRLSSMPPPEARTSSS